jgi:uncharacterized heparinase superfamily protein
MSGGREMLIDAPQDVRVQYVTDDDSSGVIVGHDGYREKYGLTHIRRLDISNTGRALMGEDTLAAIEREDQIAFDKHLDKSNSDAIGYKLRFHLHPDVDAELDMGGNAVSMALKSREIWVFRHDGKAKLTVEPSVFLEKGRLKVRATKQIVLTSRAVDYATRIRWSLAKAHETPDAVRDLAREDNDVTS